MADAQTLYQIIDPQGRIIVNYMPHTIAWQIVQLLQLHSPVSIRYMLQAVPA
ncbi:hypothetical protein [Robbsia andropogonis]|uniref:hypothetical protein n=1 Tax=Robbsia andropogonis TaxID=28092 RepID=UPI000ADE5E8E|nr:hypothetical protein [Robbsia andropogonis]